MSLIKMLARLKDCGHYVLNTADVAALLDIKESYASKIMARLTEAGHALRLKRGLWILSGKHDIFYAAEYFAAPFPAYISLQSALYYHGMISQIPSVIYCVSVGRTSLYKTPIGTFSIHHISPNFFFGYEILPGTQIKMATPEKALIDMLYLSPTKSRLFSTLPEVTLEECGFNIQKAKKIINAIPSLHRKTMINTKFKAIIGK